MTDGKETLAVIPGTFLTPATERESAQVVKTTTKRASGRTTVECRFPRSIVYRFNAIIAAERRTKTAVADFVVKGFLSDIECEPRPYLPETTLVEEKENIRLRLRTTDYEALRERTVYEGRTLDALMLRAVLNYIALSPDDPYRYDSAQVQYNPVENTMTEEETDGEA